MKAMRNKEAQVEDQICGYVLKIKAQQNASQKGETKGRVVVEKNSSELRN